MIPTDCKHLAEADSPIAEVSRQADNPPRLQEPMLHLERLDGNEVTKVAHYYLSVDGIARPMQVREHASSYARGGTSHG